MKNYERVINWIDAALTLLRMSESVYASYVHRQAYSIKDEEIRDVVVEYGSHSASLLDFVEAGTIQLSKNPKVSESCVVERIDLSAFASKWKRHVLTERTQIPELEQLLATRMEEMKRKRTAFYNEESDGYSSYSDYSEEETDSEEEDGDDATAANRE